MSMPQKAPRTLSASHRPSRLLGCVIGACSLVPVAAAADNPDAHQHGTARLQMAVEDNRVDLMFTSPAYNLAGFEHKAQTDKQKKQLADIRQWLETKPLINTGNGDCSVTKVTVQLGANSGSHQKHNHHETGHHDGKEHHHDHNHDRHHRQQETHRDYNVAQQLSCEGIAAGGTFTSPLPARFPELEELAVEWVGPAGQGSTRLTQAGQSFTLDQ